MSLAFISIALCEPMKVPSVPSNLFHIQQQSALADEWLQLLLHDQNMHMATQTPQKRQPQEVEGRSHPPQA